MAITLEKLVVELATDASQALSGMGEVQAKAQQLGTELTKTGAAMTALSAPFIAAGAAAIKIAGDFEQTEIAFTTMLKSGEAAQSFLGDLAEFAKGTPFEFPDLLDASKRLMAMGFAAEDVIPVMTTVGDTVAALGGGGPMIDRVTTALGQMLAKGKVSAEEMRQLTEAGIPAWEKLAEAIGTDVSGAMDLVQKRAVDSGPAIAAMLQGLNETFGGLMQSQMETFLGKLSNVQDTLFFLAKDIGEALMPVGIKLLDEFVVPAIDFFAELVESFKNLSPGIQEAVVVFGGLLAAAGPVVTVLGLVITAVSAVSAPVLAVVAAIGAAVGAFVLWRDEIVEFAVGFATWLRGVIEASPILSGLVNILRAIGGIVRNVVLAAWDRFISAMSTAWNWASRLFNFFRDIGRAEMEKIGTATDDTAEAMDDVATNTEKAGQQFTFATGKLVGMSEETEVAKKAAEDLKKEIERQEEAVRKANEQFSRFDLTPWIEDNRDAVTVLRDQIEELESQQNALIDIEQPLIDANRELGEMEDILDAIVQQQFDRKVFNELTLGAIDLNTNLGHVTDALEDVGFAALHEKDELGKFTGEMVKVKNETGGVQTALTQVSTAINDFGKDVARVLTGQGSVTDAFKSLGETILRIAGEQVMGFLLSQLGKLLDFLPGINSIKDALGGVFNFGGAAGQAVGQVTGAASQASGAAVGAAIGGFAGMANIIGSVGGLVTGVLGLFQNQGMAGAVDLLEEQQRRATLLLGDRADGGILGQLFRIADTLEFGTIVKVLEEIRNHTLIHTAVLEQMRDMMQGGVGIIATAGETIVTESENMADGMEEAGKNIAQFETESRSIREKAREINDSFAIAETETRAIRGKGRDVTEAVENFAEQVQRLPLAGEGVEESIIAWTNATREQMGEWAEQIRMVPNPGETLRVLMNEFTGNIGEGITNLNQGVENFFSGLGLTVNQADLTDPATREFFFGERADTGGQVVPTGPGSGGVTLTQPTSGVFGGGSGSTLENIRLSQGFGSLGTASMLVPSFQHGGSVPRDMIAKLHEGETVLPKDSAGAVVVNVTINANGVTTDSAVRELSRQVSNEIGLRVRGLR